MQTHTHTQFPRPHPPSDQSLVVTAHERVLTEPVATPTPSLSISSSTRDVGLYCAYDLSKRETRLCLLVFQVICHVYSGFLSTENILDITIDLFVLFEKRRVFLCASLTSKERVASEAKPWNKRRRVYRSKESRRQARSSIALQPDR